jgi:hypothetical protein
MAVNNYYKTQNFRMKRTKIAFGVLALGLGAIGSSFTTKSNFLPNSYFVPASGNTARTMGNPDPSNFQVSLGTTTAPASGNGTNQCSPNSSFWCAAEFTQTTIGTPHSYVSGSAIVTGTYNF